MQLRWNALSIFRYYISLLKKVYILLLQLSVTAHEAVNATSSINELALTCVEWVRGARDFNLYNWISLALEFYSVVSLAC